MAAESEPQGYPDIKENNGNGIKVPIETHRLSFIYGFKYKQFKKKFIEEGRSGEPDLNSEEVKNLRVLKDITLKIGKGKFIALCGPTGCGKSSLIRTFNGLIPHFYDGIFYGYVRVFGKDTLEAKIADLSLHVGHVFQNPDNQLVAMTVEKEIAFGLENRGVPREEIRRRVNSILKELNIEHLAHRSPFELSGGEQQRVAIASILVYEPDVIILDEPTATLDPVSAEEIIRLLKELNGRKKITVIIVEHRLDLILPHCDIVIVMSEGKVVDEGSPREVLNRNVIYEIGVNIPPYISLIKELKDKKIYSGMIPTSPREAAKIIVSLLTRVWRGSG